MEVSTITDQDLLEEISRRFEEKKSSIKEMEFMTKKQDNAISGMMITIFILFLWIGWISINNRNYIREDEEICGGNMEVGSNCARLRNMMLDIEELKLLDKNRINVLEEEIILLRDYLGVVKWTDNAIPAKDYLTTDEDKVRWEKECSYKSSHGFELSPNCKELRDKLNNER